MGGISTSGANEVWKIMTKPNQVSSADLAVLDTQPGTGSRQEALLIQQLKEWQGGSLLVQDKLGQILANTILLLH